MHLSEILQGEYEDILYDISLLPKSNFVFLKETLDNLVKTINFTEKFVFPKINNSKKYKQAMANKLKGNEVVKALSVILTELDNVMEKNDISEFSQALEHYVKNIALPSVSIFREVLDYDDCQELIDNYFTLVKGSNLIKFKSGSKSPYFN